jgi:hypothetical protein
VRGADHPTSKSQSPRVKAPRRREFARACHDGSIAIVRHTAVFFAFAAALSLTNYKGFVREMWERAMCIELSCKRAIVGAVLALTLSGCLPSTHTPERLYPVVAEMDVVRATQEELARQYYGYAFSAPSQARLIRNEIIAQRMYAIDVQYTQYENALTREGQEVNFGTLAAAGALGTASTLFTPVVTKSVLSGLSTVTLATKGHYDSEILMAQTIRTIQKQMRASRNLIAANISAKVVQSVAEYPLSAALSDVEDYYNAGTLTTGVIDTSTTVGIQETETKELKQVVNQSAPAERAKIIERAIAPVRSSVITSSREPLSETRKRRDTGPEILDPFEGSLTRSSVREIQQALCISPSGSLGPRGSATRRAIADYFSARGKTPSQAIDQRNSTFLDEAVEKVNVRNGGTCAKSGFANALAVGQSFRR